MAAYSTRWAKPDLCDAISAPRVCERTIAEWIAAYGLAGNWSEACEADVPQRNTTNGGDSGKLNLTALH
jgi:hypothetical protein